MTTDRFTDEDVKLLRDVYARSGRLQGQAMGSREAMEAARNAIKKNPRLKSVREHLERAIARVDITFALIAAADDANKADREAPRS